MALRVLFVICLTIAGHSVFCQLPTVSQDQLIVDKYNWLLGENKNLECKPVTEIKETKVANCQFVDAFEMFPNPTESNVTIIFKAHKEETNIIISTMEGKVVYSENLIDFSGDYNKTLNIDTKGMLILGIRQKDEVFTKKLIVQ